MKTQEELKQLKKDYQSLVKKLEELTEDELELVTGGTSRDLDITPVENPIGTNEDKNSIPPDVNSR